MEELLCISPIDGRYHNTTEKLNEYFSEYALIKYRVVIEIKWLLKLNEVISINFSLAQINALNSIIANFNICEAKKVKEIEAITKHDVKAVEYYLRDKFDSLGLSDFKNYIHFGCTSEDINNLAYGLMIKNSLYNVFIPSAEDLINTVANKAKKYRNLPMLAHTHGQPATPTTVGKELAVFVYRWQSILKLLKTINLRGKFSGAVGNFNAHVVAFPNLDWIKIGKEFVESLGLEFNPLTTQIESHDIICVIFNYIKSSNPEMANVPVVDYPIELLDKIKATDIEEYLEYLRYYVTEDGKEHTNGERGIMRKLACLRTLYRYFYKKESIKTNPASIVDMPKIHEKEIVRLDADEVSVLLDQVELGDKLTKSQQKFHDKTKTRDMAILTLLLGTGMRVSECVGIDINDIDFKNSGIKIRRKGGNETVIYFGEEVENALLDYLEERKLIVPQDGYENALFLSLQKRRIGVRAVENLVKKYSSLVTNLKKITPHKLRSTYGTALYKETGDIYLVADVLGHKDVNTTKKHYAAIEDERRRKARNAVKLRKD